MRTRNYVRTAVLFVRVDEREPQKERWIDRHGQVGGEQHPITMPILARRARGRTIRGIGIDFDVVVAPQSLEQLQDQQVLADLWITERHLKRWVNLETLLLYHAALTGRSIPLQFGRIPYFNSIHHWLTA